MDAEKNDYQQDANQKEPDQPNDSEPAMQSAKPTTPGRPKKKALEQRSAAQERASVLAAARAQPIPDDVLIYESALSRSVFDRAEVDQEPVLALSCWVGYRRMTLMARNEEFTRIYIKGYLALEQRRTGKVLADSKPLEAELMLESPDVITAINTARARADAMGIPYPIYVGVLMQSAVERDKWNRPPRPNQLYGKLEEPRMRGRPTVDDIKRSIDQCAAAPQFAAANYRAEPDQVQMHMLIRTVVEHAVEPAKALRRYIGTLGLISEAQAREIFREALVDSAIAGGLPAVTAARTAGPFRPGCFGQQNLELTECKQCPVVVACTRISESVVAEVVARTGTDDPRLAHKRNVDRLRQQRCRAQQKLIKVAAAERDKAETAERDKAKAEELAEAMKRRPVPARDYKAMIEEERRRMQAHWNKQAWQNDKDRRDEIQRRVDARAAQAAKDAEKKKGG